MAGYSGVGLVQGGNAEIAVHLPYLILLRANRRKLRDAEQRD